MIDNFDDPSFKFMTKQREKYQELRDVDTTGLFSSIINTFAAAFAIGFHLQGTRSVKDGTGKAINHANLVNLKTEVREVIAILVCDRHPEISNSSELWHKVEEYAEYGIQILHSKMKENGWEIVIDDILGYNDEMKS